MPNLDEWLNENAPALPVESAPKLAAAADINPAQAAEALKQARRNNLPPELFANGPDPDIARQNSLADQADHLRSSPALDQWLARQPFPVAASVRDDIPQLSKIGQAVQFAKNTGSALYSGVPAFSEGFYGLIEAGGGMLPDIVGDPIEQFGSYYRQRMAASKEYLTPKSDSAIGQGYYSGLQSVTQMLATLPMAVMSGNPALVALPMAGVTAGQAYGQAREKGLGVGQSTLFGIEQGAVEYITERIPAGKLVEDLAKSTGFGKMLLGQLAKEIPSEQAATFLQDFNEWVNLNPEKSLGEFVRERPDAAISTAVATLVGSGVVSSAAYSANRLVQRVAKDDARIQQAQEGGKLLSDLSALAQASVVRERDVQTFEGFLQTATDGTPLEAVYIDAKTLQDSGLAEKLAQQSPTVAEQLPQAQAGTMIRIPTEEVMGRFHQDMVPLLPELRLDPNGMNQREAEDFMANRGEQLQAEVEQVLSNAQADAETMQARERVKASLASDIMATGRVTKDVAESYATLASTFYHVMGQRLGVNAEELYNQHRLGVQGQGTGEFDQSGPSRRERLRQLHTERGVSFVDSTIDRGGAHTPAGPQSGSPAYDVSLNGTYPEDFYGPNGLRYYGTGYESMDAEVYSQLRRLEGRPNHPVTVYRAVEKDGPSKIAPGDWVTISRAYAKDHGQSALNGDYKIIKQIVNARDIYTSGDSMLEWGYHPQDRMPELPKQQATDQLYQSVTLRSGKETLKKYGLEPGKSYKTREVAAALEARQRAKYGNIEANDRSPEAVKRIAKWMAEEVAFEMENPGKSGVGWYSEKYQRALDIFAQEFPELATDQAARDMMTALVAITSDGQKVVPNFLQAADIYANFRATGKFTTNRGHIRQDSILNNLERLQLLYDTLGPEEMRAQLMQEFPVSKLKQIATEKGLKFSTDYQASVMLPLSAVVLGPKLGAFYANLMGAHGYLTMDRWWSRTFNRYRGNLLTSATRAGLDNFKQLLGRPEMSDDEVLSAIVKPHDDLEARNFKTRLAVIVGSSEPSKANEKAAWMAKARKLAGDQFDELLAEHNLERAANTLYKHSFINLQDKPFSATDRTFMLNSVAEAARVLKRRGIDMSVADIQAVLWYYEKRLYGELGARQTADISYEEAAQRVIELRAAGVDTAEGLAASGVGEDSADGTADGAGPGEDEFDQGGDGEFYQSASQLTDTKEFRSWFGNSKVVDQNGAPLVVYHGTTAAFDAFDKKFNGAVTRATSSRSGFFFSSSARTAQSYADHGATVAPIEKLVAEADKAGSRGNWDEYDKKIAEAERMEAEFADPANRGRGQNIVPVYLAMSNPLVYDAKGENPGGIGGIDALIQQAKKAGHDGVIIKNFDDSAGLSNDVSDHYIVFDPTQIKSVFNRGTFDPSDPNILNQNQGEARGSFSPSELVIRLTKASDLSTYLHESGHFFLHMLTEFAARPDAPADIRADADAALKWMGVESTPELSRVDAWRAMTVEEQRAAHEKFARGFEVYLSEGKAPSMELQGLFARFRSWLLNVYRYLKQGMAKGLDVQLNDEVRAVFDRMLATEDEIQNAEAARSMGMMFTTEAEAAKFGVDWRGYQAQAQAATDEAVAAMDAKTVKNMRWLDNARSRLLSKMQSEARTVRREVRTGVRTEVMSQPVYQAYQFLTGKLTDDDRQAMERQAPMKSKAGPLDPRIDSLFVAIAKLGGINRESLQSQWGFDPATKIPPPYFGGHVIRAEGGDSIDGMLQQLEAYGYLPLDEYGRAWTNEFEDRFYAELRGDKQYSTGFDPTLLLEDEGLSAPVQIMGSGRLREADLMALARDNEIPSEVIDTLVKRRMVAKERGLNPEVVAFQFGFGSADEMVRALAEAAPPREAIETATDQRMLERYSDLATPEGRERAVDAALAGEARTRMVETELSALEAANNTRTVTQDGKGKTRRVNTLPAAARQFARQVIDRLRVRDVRPAQFSGSASRAARAAGEAARAGKVPEAALEKRNELVNMYAARYANDALDGVRSGLAYLKKFDKDGTRKNIDADYLDQIDAILERYDLRQQTQKGLDRRKALADWIAEQEAAGIEPDLPPHIAQERMRAPYQELTVEEFNGLVDSVRQIEHFGRLKKKLLLAKDKREFAALVQEIRVSIAANAGGRRADNATRTDLGGRLAQAFKGFTAAHRKMASLVYQLDGFKDGGPLWEVLIRTANEQGNWEATKQAELTERLAKLLKGVKRDSRFSRGRYFKGVDMSLTHEQRLVVALNWGNAGNQQRLLDGRNWSAEGVQEVLDTLTKEDWDFVQGVWDTFESLRPSIAEKERRVMGKEPDWVQPSPVVTKFGTLKGGYYPAVYDPRQNLKAAENESAEAVKRQLQGARSAATTRRNFVKARATEVKGRPLLLTMDGLFRGLTDVVHDLAYHEWLIDANRLLRALDPEIRDTYGAEVVNQLRAAKDAIAAGEASAPHALDTPVRHIRTGAMVAGLGFNLVNAMLQPLGITQSVVRVGGRWIAQGAGRLAANPRALARDVMEKSEFMRNRARTQNRELNDVRNRLRGKSETRQFVDAALFWPMTTMQLGVDLPTWWGAYQKALHDGADEDTAVQRADQAVIDSQGGGQIKDLAAIQRGPELAKLFTTFYGYFSTAYNLGVERYRATDKTSPVELLKLAGDFLLLYSVPAVFGLAIKEAMAGGGGGDDEDEIAKKLAREQLSYLFGLMVGVREMTGAAQMALGLQPKGAGYGGPAGLRFLQELQKLAQQVNQGEWDEAARRSIVNVGGILLHLPSAQINRTLDGIDAMREGRTQNPAALIGGAK